MDHAPVIREATPGDAEGLERCMHSAYAIYLDRMDAEQLPPLNLDYANEIQRYPTWVVEIDGTIVGGLVMVFGADLASVANIGVAQEAQGRGIGKRLLQHAERQVGARGFREIRLATHVLLSENVSLYQHLGFREESRDESRVYLRKSL